MFILLFTVLLLQDVPQDPLSCDQAFLKAPVDITISSPAMLTGFRDAIKFVEQEYGRVTEPLIPNMTHLWVAIDRGGRVAKAIVSRSSTSAQQDSAALRAMRKFVFRPATSEGKPVCSWVQLPVAPPTASVNGY
jgi:TonB family protein